MKHPLINPDSAHYDSWGGEPAIARFERNYTVGELMAWARLNFAKYSDPAREAKGQIHSDKKKAATFLAYYNFLLDIVRKAPHLREVSAKKAYTILGIDLEY